MPSAAEQAIRLWANGPAPAVEPRGGHCAQEELAAIGVWSSIRHAQNTGPGVLELEILILKLLAINGLSSRPVAPSEVST